MKIGSRSVGPTYPVFVIAEIGSNWGTSVDAAMALIDAAADAGADCAKFQAGHADHVYDPAQFPDEHASFKKWIDPTLAILALLKGKCDERGIEFMCSVFCLDALDQVDPYVNAHKVASIESQWRDFVVAVVEKRKPMLVSLGMRDTSNAGFDVFDVPYVVLECAVSYPLALEDANLRAHPYGRHGWGLSDHTTNPTIAPCAAVALGACVIEKHLRLMDNPKLRASDPAPDPNTPDAAHSLDYLEFTEMVTAIRLTEQALGSSEKRIRESERPYLKYRRGPKGLRGS